MVDELLLGTTVLSRGGRTNVPKQVMELLKLKPSLHMRHKILWMQERDEITVSKGTSQSSFRKTILSRDGTAAVPRHIREILKLKSIPHREDRMLWIRKGNEIVVRKGAPQLSPTN